MQSLVERGESVPSGLCKRSLQEEQEGSARVEVTGPIWDPRETRAVRAHPTVVLDEMTGANGKNVNPE